MMRHLCFWDLRIHIKWEAAYYIYTGQTSVNSFYRAVFTRCAAVVVIVVVVVHFCSTSVLWIHFEDCKAEDRFQTREILDDVLLRLFPSSSVGNTELEPAQLHIYNHHVCFFRFKVNKSPGTFNICNPIQTANLSRKD